MTGLGASVRYVTTNRQLRGYPSSWKSELMNERRTKTKNKNKNKKWDLGPVELFGSDNYSDNYKSTRIQCTS